MFAKTQSRSIAQLLVALLAGALLLSACSPAVATIMPPDPTATSAPEPTAVPTTDDLPLFSLDTGSMATGFQIETVAAASADNDAPYWEILPEYTRVTLQGYPISNHLMTPQIFIYPVQELGKINEGAGQIITSLQSLLQSPREIQLIPFLPLINAAQMMHVQLQYLDFKNGQGLRFITQFSQGIVPINNYELIYTYQGLTSDGKFYVAAVLPVNHLSLPADAKDITRVPLEFTSDYSAYKANVITTLNTQAAATFTPDLTQLDAMLSSLEIK